MPLEAMSVVAKASLEMPPRSSSALASGWARGAATTVADCFGTVNAVADEARRAMRRKRDIVKGGCGFCDDN